MDVNTAFKSACRVLLGREIGELREFEPYLLRVINPLSQKASSLSKKKLYIASEYCKGAKLIAYDEMEKLKIAPLNINKIKDMDSLLCEVSERFYYCGSKNLGNSMQVQESDECIDSSFVHHSYEVLKSEYVAYSAYIRESSYLFGTSWAGGSAFCLSCHGLHTNTRCFETYYSGNLTDSHFCYQCNGCSNCLFSFNQRGKHYMIGNLELAREKYLEIKKSLLGEVAEELSKKKAFPSLFTLVD
ncbi:hypothetical protein AUJ17_01845 [Candidatus Micrarchaeota archaeon CG1_02_47_40]|nr:MAG: hypothetical protein AUJ17_01845 [Candidatus Micrarchaeota archaeon CG1_02_47_40]